jgi:hypothetical protein
MRCFVGGSGRENLMFFFPAKKAQDVAVVDGEAQLKKKFLQPTRSECSE